MHLQPMCSMEMTYTGDFHLTRPYGGESGSGWGIGTGTVAGARLQGSFTWSNHPQRRGDGTMLPSVRGVISTVDGAEVFFDMSGRTVFVERAGAQVGRQLLLALFESADERYRELNDTVCVVEGVIDVARLLMHLDVHECVSDLV
jgi:hypothetical protein